MFLGFLRILYRDILNKSQPRLAQEDLKIWTTLVGSALHKKHGSIWRFPESWRYPPIILVHGIFHYKPSILGYPLLWTPPYKCHKIPIIAHDVSISDIDSLPRRRPGGKSGDSHSNTSTSSLKSSDHRTSMDCFRRKSTENHGFPDHISFHYT